MIKESLGHTIRLIEDIQKVDPVLCQELKAELDDLVQHMKIVMGNLDRTK
jgi:hypothetical protein